jgi:uncharacterized membrane protein (UPF0127 family)
LKPLPITSLAAIATVALIFVAAYLLTAEDDAGADGQRVRFELPDGEYLHITCEVADTSYERAEGLQHRDSLPVDRGMLFVYDEPDEKSFIMRNMNFPLDIIFIAENGTVLNVEEAEPEEPGTANADLIRYRSAGKAKWVVEINQGLSEQYGIGPGTQFQIAPDV